MTPGTPGLVIREAIRDDLEAVVGLLREDVIREIDESEVAAASYADAFDEITADAHQQLLVGELDGEVVATGQLTWVRHLTYVGGLMCVVESVRVRSDRRGRGHGRTLMEHVIGLARDRGAARVELTTNARRTRARKFYEDLGFEAEADDLAMHVLAFSQGVATLSNAFHDSDFVYREVERINTWLTERLASHASGDAAR